MRGFSTTELRRFSDGVQELHQSSDVEALSRRTLRLVTGFVPGDTAVFGDQKLGGPFRSDAFILNAAVEYGKFQNAYTAHLHEHPVNKQFRSEEHTSELQSLRHLVCR